VVGDFGMFGVNISTRGGSKVSKLFGDGPIKRFILRKRNLKGLNSTN
jgi:hypothetical protein